MVPRDASVNEPPPGGEATGARCASPAGASPVPVSAGAPGRRPRAGGGTAPARAGCRKAERRRKPCSRELARGPQHEVKKEKQSGGRAAHVTAKATPATPAPEGGGSRRGTGRSTRAR